MSGVAVWNEVVQLLFSSDPDEEYVINIAEPIPLRGIS